jgi:preprotein translocase subunit SecA
MRPVSVADIDGPTPDAVEEQAIAVGEAAYRAREAEFTAPVLRDLERHLYLYTLDEHWRDHLYELDHLKGGIGLRAYGQRDPLIEYKKEAFTLFETLVGEVRDEFVQRLFRVQLQTEPMRQIERRPPPRQLVAQHAEASGAFAAQQRREAAASGGGDGRGAPEREPEPARVVQARSGPRVGRNDPCPCGSGKKYKKCHMLIDEGAETGT